MVSCFGFDRIAAELGIGVGSRASFRRYGFTADYLIIMIRAQSLPA